MNTALRQGQYFFTDIRREGIVLYELDDEPLAEPKPQSPADALKLALEHFHNRMPMSANFHRLSAIALSGGMLKESAFLLHQPIEHTYSTLLLVLTNYSPPSHKLSFLRALAEDHDRRLSGAWPREQQRHRAWLNTLNEAYVKARYSKHYEISEEALVWLADRTAELHTCAELICVEHLTQMKETACS
ncbi:HEPN domain-containing protein [Mesorhizobium sp. M0488]|uniref:HEPN domain-containing protein n=1 Tax=unclassified Mesorhizobium TaxID=325217 RepID=UPI00333A9D0C